MMRGKLSLSKAKNGWSLLVALLSLLPLPAVASSVEIDRWSTQDDRVTLKVKVLDDDNVPIQGLNRQAFKINTTDGQVNPVESSAIRYNLVPPEKQRNPDDAYVVVLLDMSGSMGNDDSSDIPKLKGAVQAIENFIDQVSNENLPVKVSLVPFGYRGASRCNYLYEVDKQTIESNSPFLSVTDDKLKLKLKQLSQVPVCAQTNLHQPLVAASSYLKEQISQVESNLDPENAPHPRLTIVLLSDGFETVFLRSDGYGQTSDEQFKGLKKFLQQEPQVTVNTFGYGIPLHELQKQASCLVFIPNDQLSPETVRRYCRLPDRDIVNFIIDEPLLRSLAKATGGIYQLSSDANAVAESLADFLTTLREYELEYRQPGADGGTRHTTVVQVSSPDRNLNLSSNSVAIRMPFIYKVLRLPERLGILGFTILVGLVGTLSFKRWSKMLKEQADRNL